MRIAVLLPDLRPGGAERMRVQMADVWLRRGFNVEFVLLKREGDLLAQLPIDATIVDLAAPRFRSAFIPLVRYLRGRKPDVLLAAMWPLTVLAPLAARMARFSGRVVISEHSPLSLAYANHTFFHGVVMRASMRFAYPLANARIGVSCGVADELAVLSGIPRNKFQVIYNPAAGMHQPSNLLQKPAAFGGSATVILTVGTLKKVKRHDLLIRAFSRIDNADVRLCILGEGQERAGLEELVHALGLQEKVLLPGYTADPAPWYAHADIFVLASDYEGFGNVIVEALEHGVPVVSTNCPVGPREILEDGKYGALVPAGDVDALATAMQAALEATHDHAALKTRAQDFAVEKIADEYLALLLPNMCQMGSEA